MTPAIAPLAGRYTLLEPLGEGGMGTVYRVEDATTGDQLALKVMKGAEASPADVLRFKQEFRALTRLRHPNVCEVRDYGVTPEGHPFFTMELVPGEGLDARRPLPASEVAALLPQMIAALGYVHARGLVHADVKPENFRLRPDGVLKLMDFGLIVQSGQRNDGVAGTLAYVSPEAAKGDRLDARADLYALGAVLYELLTGEPPFRGDTPLAVLRAHLREVPAPPRALVPSVPEALDRAVMRLLAKEPAARFASAAELAAALDIHAAVDEAARLLAAPFVGREEILTAAARRLDARNGGCLALSGPPGIGKSRVLDELRVQAQLAQRPWAAGSADGEPYAPFVAATRALLPLARTVCPDVLAAQAPALARLLPELAATSAPAREDEDGTRLPGAFARLLAGVLAPTGGVLALDTWDLADAGSRDALAMLLRHGASMAGPSPEDASPFLVVVAGRSLPALPGEAIALTGLAPADAGAMAAGMLGLPALPEALTAQLHQLTDGNPAALAGLLAHAIAAAAITRQQGQWQLPSVLPPAALSAGARERLVEALAGVGDAARAVARRVAVLAEGFDFTLMSAVCGVPEDDLFDAVDALETAGVLEIRHGAYHLAPPELRAVLADELAVDERSRAHAAAAAALAARVAAVAAPDFATLRELSRHLAAAGPAQEAARAALAVATAAALLGAQAVGLEHVGAALGRVAELPEGAHRDALTAELLLAEAALRIRAAQLAEADAAFTRALALAEGVADGRLIGRILAGHAQLLNTLGKPASAVAERAIEAARAAADMATFARAAVNHGRNLVLGGQTERGRAWCEEGLQAARAHGLRLFEGRALASLGYARTSRREELDAGLTDMRAAIAILGEVGDRYGDGYTRNLMADVLLRVGRFQEVLDVTAKAIVIMRELNYTDDVVASLCNDANAAAELGDLERAQRDADEVVEVARREAHGIARTYGVATAGKVRALRGDALAAAEQLAAADQAAKALGSYLQAAILPNLIDGWLALGRLETARATLQEALFALRDFDDAAVQAQLAGLQASVHAAAGRWDDVATFAEQACGLARAHGLDATLARALALQAAAALHADQPAEAGRLADQAHAIAVRTGMRPLLTLLAGVQGGIALRANPAAAMGHFQAMQVLADDVGLPACRAWALFGQAEALPHTPQAPALLAEAQRLVRGLVQAWPEAVRPEVERFPAWRAVLDRNPAVAASIGAGLDAGARFADQFQRVSGDLQALFTQYGAMHAEWEASNARLRRLNEVAGRMGESIQLDEVLRRVIALTLEITGAERGFVILRDRHARYVDLVCRAAFDHQGRPVPPEQHSLTISQRILDAGQAVAILDASADAEFQAARSVVGLNLRTVMGVPLAIQGEMIGALYVDSRAVVTTFTDVDLELLRALAIHATNAIEHARLYQALDARAAELEEALQKYRQAEAAASTDALTGLANRRRFVDEAEREILISRRYERPMTVLILDVDHFKSFNDTYGHAVGDEVLKAVAAAMPPHVREHDLPARLGGEEFVVLCPHASAAEGAAVAERIREAIAAVRLTDADGTPVRQVTASIGVAELRASDKGIGDTLERADSALYACKHGGRNQVQVWRDGMALKPG